MMMMRKDVDDEDEEEEEEEDGFDDDDDDDDENNNNIIPLLYAFIQIQYLPAHTVHNLHSLGSIPARRYLVLNNCLTNNDGRILPGTHLTH